MKPLKRVIVATASTGWIAPLSLAFAASQDFIWRTYQIANGRGDAFPWHPFDLVVPLFYGAMVWLGIVIVGWSLFLTGRR